MSAISFDQVADYYANPRLEVLRQIPKTAKRILDVGCGAGAFGSVIKALNKAEVWGIEYEPEPFALAQLRLDRAFNGKVEDLLSELPDSHFDLVTFNDVLEHLAYPIEVLSKIRRVLSPGGMVFASVPNIRYWPEFKRLAWDGDFPQEDSGIFDRTHLRFFTEKSMPRMFEEAGYEVTSLTGINPTQDRWLNLLNRVTSNRFADCRFLQYAVQAVPSGLGRFDSF